MKNIRLFSLLGLLLTLVCCSSSGSDGDVDKGSTSLVCTPTEISVDESGGTVSVTVKADREWTVFTDAKWISLRQSGSSAPGGTVEVTVAANTEEKVREGSFTVKAGTERVSVSVVQQPYKGTGVDIADDAFRKYLLDKYDSDNDGILNTKEIEGITELNISGLGIASLPELNTLFSSITRLDCSGNELPSLDISKLSDLTYLDCSGNKLSALNLSGNKKLTHLDCSENSISELNVAALTKLEYLDCSANAVKSLDVQDLRVLSTCNAADNAELASIAVWYEFIEPAGFSKPSSAVYTEPEMIIPEGYELVWHDEFTSSDEVISPSTDDWWYETGDGGWGNNELQDYVAGGIYQGEKLAAVSNGELRITAKKIGNKVRSVRMNSAGSWTYGYFEARLKLCSGKGTWPAFWMMPQNYRAWPDDGEIDIMEEVGYNPNYVSSSIHCKAYYHSIGTQKTHEMLLSGAQDSFHTYALEWTETEMRFLFDGQVHFTFENDGTGNRDTWPFDAPFYLKLNLAWGGDWGGAMGVDESCLPAVYEIDYVRVFSKTE